jgi:hypothetical protein
MQDRERTLDTLRTKYALLPGWDKRPNDDDPTLPRLSREAQQLLARWAAYEGGATPLQLAEAIIRDMQQCAGSVPALEDDRQRIAHWGAVLSCARIVADIESHVDLGVRRGLLFPVECDVGGGGGGGGVGESSQWCFLRGGEKGDAVAPMAFAFVRQAELDAHLGALDAIATTDVVLPLLTAVPLDAARWDLSRLEPLTNLRRLALTARGDADARQRPVLASLPSSVFRRVAAHSGVRCKGRFVLALDAAQPEDERERGWPFLASEGAIDASSQGQLDSAMQRDGPAEGGAIAEAVVRFHRRAPADASTFGRPLGGVYEVRASGLRDLTLASLCGNARVRLASSALKSLRIVDVMNCTLFRQRGGDKTGWWLW